MENKSNKMGVMPINKLIINMSLPMIVSMLVQALYNIVDSIFVAKISENALTAVSLAFPIQNMLIAVGVGTGVGVNSLISRSLGEGKRDFAGQVAENGIFLAALSYIAVLIASFFLIKPFLRFQTDSPEIFNYGVDYLTVVCYYSFGIMVVAVTEKIIQAAGKTFYTMITQGIGAVINIILDPILIFGLLGAPKMGIKGAAIATVIGQIVSMGFALFFQHTINHDVKIKIREFRPRAGIIKKIYAVGVPSIIMLSIGSLMVFGMNKILMGFTSTATAVFGVYFKVQSFVFMPVFGLNSGLVPIMAYNYGAQNRGRLIKTIKYGIYYAVSIMLLGLIVTQSVPQLLLKAFNASEEMLAIGVPALRILSTVYIPAAVCIIIGSSFQALGLGMPSMIVSFARQLVVLLPTAYLLSLARNLNIVWLSFPIAELASVVITLLFFRKIYRTYIAVIE